MIVLHKQIKLSIVLFALIMASPFIKAEPGIKWSLLTGGAVYSSPAYENGMIFIGSDDGNLYSLN